MMEKTLSVLSIEDSEDDTTLLIRELRRSGYQVTFERVDTAPALLTALDTSSWDVILSDYSMPAFSAPAALQLVQERGLDLPFIIVSGTVGEDVAVAAMKAGAHDFFTKDKLQRLVPAIERELREAEERRKRRIVEEELRQSEQRFAKAFQASPVGISITAPDGRFVDVNDYFLNLFGYTRDEVIGRTSMELNLWSDWAERERIQQILQQNSTVRNLEGRCRTRSGEIRDVWASFETIEVAGKTCVLSLLHDITERKEAQDELRALYNATSYLFQADSLLSLGQQIVQAVVQEFNQVDCGLMLVDRERNRMVRLARRGTSRIRPEAPLYLDQQGLVSEAVNGETFIYVPDVTLDARYKPNNPQTRSEFVVPLRTSKGVIGVLDLQSVKVDAFSERDRRIVIAFSERVAAAIESMQLYEALNQHAAELEWRVAQRTAELQQAKERVEAIFNNSSDAIILVYTNGMIQQINQAFTHMFGYLPEAVYGQSLTALFISSQMELLNTTLYSVATTGEVARVDLIARRSDGLYFDVELAVASIMEKSREQTHLICSIRDITARKQAEEELRKALDKEKELNELKSRFVSMVSHEFRTPLTTIRSSSEFLKLYKERLSEEKQQHHLQRILIQVDRMTDMLNDVLTLSRSDNVGFVCNPTPVDFRAFCRDLVDETQLIAPNHQLELLYSCDLQMILIDEDLMRHVLTNLLSNAIKYSPDGSSVYFEVMCESEQVLVHVRDQGIGIPQEDQPRLFEAFHRARNVSTIQGTGLGLSIVKRAVEAHGGTIHFESKIDMGTTFTLQLPLNVPSTNT